MKTNTKFTPNYFFKIKTKFFLNYKKNCEYWVPKYKYRKQLKKYLQKTHWSIYNITHIMNSAFNLNLPDTEIINYNLLFIYNYLELINSQNNEFLKINVNTEINDDFMNSNIKNEYNHSYTILNKTISFIIEDIIKNNNNNKKDYIDVMYYLLWFSVLYSDYCLSKINFQNIFFKKDNISNTFRNLNHCVDKYTKILQNKLPKDFNYLVQNINKVFYYNI